MCILATSRPNQSHNGERRSRLQASYTACITLKRIYVYSSSVGVCTVCVCVPIHIAKAIINKLEIIL